MGVDVGDRAAVGYRWFTVLRNADGMAGWVCGNCLKQVLPPPTKRLPLAPAAGAGGRGGGSRQHAGHLFPDTFLTSTLRRDGGGGSRRIPGPKAVAKEFVSPTELRGRPAEGGGEGGAQGPLEGSGRIGRVGEGGQSKPKGECRATPTLTSEWLRTGEPAQTPLNVSAKWRREDGGSDADDDADDVAAPVGKVGHGRRGGGAFSCHNKNTRGLGLC